MTPNNVEKLFSSRKLLISRSSRIDLGILPGNTDAHSLDTLLDNGRLFLELFYLELHNDDNNMSRRRRVLSLDMDSNLFGTV